jgi:PAS domain S-box-containing protein
MEDFTASRQELIDELASLRLRNEALEKALSQHDRVEEALRKSLEQYRTLVENASDVVFRTDDRGGFTFINPSGVRLIGYAEGEMLGKHYTLLIRPDRREAAKTFFRDQFLKRIPNAYSEFPIVTKGGRELWFGQNTQLIVESGKVTGFQAIARDITDLKRAESQLRRQNDYLEALNETALGLMGRTELADLFQTLVVRAARFAGSEEAWICLFDLQTGDFEFKAGFGRSSYQIGTRFPAGRGIAGEVWRTGRLALVDNYQTWPGRANVAGYEVRRATVAVPLQIEGRLAGILGLSHHDPECRFEPDEVVMLERMAELASIALDNARLYDQLTRELAERKRLEEERDTIQAQLFQSQKMEAVGTLAGGIAHDFNNLLMGIQGYTSLALLDIDPFHPNYDRLKRIESQVQSGADLTRQLLGFARGGRYEVTVCDMNEVLEKTSSMFGRTRREIAIRRRFAEDLWHVHADRGQMEQVFMNLYLNALQAMPGGGEILLETENIVLDDLKVVPYAVKPGCYVKMMVTDNGTGMDEKTKARIFEPFFTTKGLGRGTGLGLASVYGIVKGHGGMINVYSEPGHGTTFSIYLPAPEPLAPEESKAPEPIARGSETVLLVDDEEIVLDVSREILEFLGYRVFAAANGQEALRLFAERKDEIDIVLLDMIMPGMSGGETFDRLHQLHPGVRVVLSSGYSVNGQAREILDRGCRGFIQKPFHLEKLSRKLREVLDAGAAPPSAEEPGADS